MESKSANRSGQSYLLKIFTTLLLLIAGGFYSQFALSKSGSGCLGCHNGIESIRDPSSAMMVSIKAMGAAQGDAEG
jgi:hypothetical protein